MTGNTNKRFLALDILRGLTIAFMCIVNNPGTWSHVYAPLRHSPWNGCTPTDLVYPFFIFCMGVAMAFAFSKFEGLSAAAAKKIFKRSFLIFLTGFLLNIFPFYNLDPGHFRIPGVLQRIALSYLLASLIVLGCKKDVKKVAVCGVGLAVMFTCCLLTGGDLSLEGNAARKLDLAVFGENYIYHGYGIPFDPEGLLGTLTGACTAILGFLTGSMIKKGTDARSTIIKLLVSGLLCLGAGKLLDIWLPINKPLWSVSFVLYAGGWAMLALCLISFLTDELGWSKIFVPAQAMGMNALMAFILSGCIARLFSVSGWYPGQLYFSANELTSLCYALLFMLLIFCLLWLLYKKKIFIKF